MDEEKTEPEAKPEEAVVEPEAVKAEVRPEFTAADKQDHTGTVCPFCNINGVCGHPVKFPAVCGAAPWVPNVWVKGP